MLSHLRIPHNRNEWYFIVANYNPSVTEYIRDGGGSECNSTGNECAPTGVNDLSTFSDYWRWNVSYGALNGCQDSFSVGGVVPSTDVASANANLNSPNSNCGVSEDYLRVGAYTNYSGEGAKCKVEVISRTELLRARGYKT